MIFSFLKSEWFRLFEVVGLLTSFTLSFFAFKHANRATNANVHLSIGEAHDRIWSRLFTKPELGRVRTEGVNLNKHPITPEEQQLILLVLSHLTSTLQAIKLGKYPSQNGLEADARQFFSKPIPAAVYEKYRETQEPILRDFLEKALQ